MNFWVIFRGSFDYWARLAVQHAVGQQEFSSGSVCSTPWHIPHQYQRMVKISLFESLS